MPDPNDHRLIYGDHLLNHTPVPLDDGRFRARVVITALKGEHTIAQRFLDLAEFDSAAAASAHGRQEGIAWVDRQSVHRTGPA